MKTKKHTIPTTTTTHKQNKTKKNSYGYTGGVGEDNNIIVYDNHNDRAFTIGSECLNSIRSGSNSSVQDRTDLNHPFVLPSQLTAENAPWEMSIQALKNTLEYIYELHHTCYFLCVCGGDGGNITTLYKLTSRKSPPLYKTELNKQLVKLKTSSATKQIDSLINDDKKDFRVMQCIIKEIKTEQFSQEYLAFLELFKRDGKLPLPQGTYILNLTDAVLLRKDGRDPFGIINNNKEFVKPDQKFIPILSTSGHVDFWDIPIPNYDDVEFILAKNKQQQEQVKQFYTEWNKKPISKAVFRGGPTGCGNTKDTNMRIRISTMNGDDDLLDAGIVSISKSVRIDPLRGIGIPQIPANVLLKPRLSMVEQSRYKYIIHIDGNVHAYRLLYSMLTGSLILRVGSNYTSWVEDMLRPNIHYVPIHADLSNLISVIKWCNENQTECEQIAKNGHEFAKRVLQKEYIKNAFIQILEGGQGTQETLPSPSPLNNNNIETTPTTQPQPATTAVISPSPQSTTSSINDIEQTTQLQPQATTTTVVSPSPINNNNTEKTPAQPTQPPLKTATNTTLRNKKKQQQQPTTINQLLNNTIQSILPFTQPAQPAPQAQPPAPKPPIRRKPVAITTDTTAPEYIEKQEYYATPTAQQTGDTFAYDFLYPYTNDPDFQLKLAKRKEFFNIRYDGTIYDDIKKKSDQLCNIPFELAPHQVFVRNFLSANTPYNSLLLYHGLGSGKTCSAIGIAEEMRLYIKQLGNVNIHKIYVIASENVQNNFKLQLFDERKLKLENNLWTINSCVGNAILKEVNPSRLDVQTAETETRRKIMNSVSSLIKSYYHFMGYEKFAKQIEKILLTATPTATAEAGAEAPKGKGKAPKGKAPQRKSTTTTTKGNKKISGGGGGDDNGGGDNDADDDNKEEDDEDIEKGIKEINNPINNLTEEQKQQKIKELEKRITKQKYDNRLIIIDEIHNIRRGTDGKMKKIMEGLFKIAEHCENTKFLFLSATPMYNKPTEIVDLLNIMNLNDKRPTVNSSSIFTKNGDLIGDKDIAQQQQQQQQQPPQQPKKRTQRANPAVAIATANNKIETGQEILQRKLMGYVSYVRGENPYYFPFRIYPDTFAPDRNLNAMTYPKYQLNSMRIRVPKRVLPVYINRISNYQKMIYLILTHEYRTNPEYRNLHTFKYELTSTPLMALNIVYPYPEEEQLLTSVQQRKIEKYFSVPPPAEELTRTQTKMETFLKDNKKRIQDKVIGENGLKSIFTFTTNEKTGEKTDFVYKPNASHIFKRELLPNYSSKIANICECIRKSTGVVLIYSSFIYAGIIPMALALEEMGIKRYEKGGGRSFFREDEGVRPKLDAKTMKTQEEWKEDGAGAQQFKQARYITITGDKNISPNNEIDVKHASSRENKYGENVKVVLISLAGSEGLDFTYIRQIHILDSWFNLNRIEQIIGRGVRNQSHCGLPFEEKNVEIYMHGSILTGEQKEEGEEDTTTQKGGVKKIKANANAIANANAVVVDKEDIKENAPNPNTDTDTDTDADTNNADADDDYDDDTDADDDDMDATQPSQPPLPHEIEAIDLYLYRIATNKSHKIGKITRLLKEISVDCILNLGQTNFTEEKFKNSGGENIKIPQILSTNNQPIIFKIGDKPFSSACDYMDNCVYKCSSSSNKGNNINAPEDIVEDTGASASATTSTYFVQQNMDTIIQRIRQLFLDKSVYHKDELIQHIQIGKKMFPVEQIYYTLQYMVRDKTEYITDNLGRTGVLVNKKNIYAFQPIEITDTNISIYERMVPIQKRNHYVGFTGALVVGAEEDIAPTRANRTTTRAQPTQPTRAQPAQPATTRTQQPARAPATSLFYIQFLEKIKKTIDYIRKITNKISAIRTAKEADKWEEAFISIFTTIVPSLMTTDELIRFYIEHHIEKEPFENKIQMFFLPDQYKQYKDIHEIVQTYFKNNANITITGVNKYYLYDEKTVNNGTVIKQMVFFELDIANRSINQDTIQRFDKLNIRATTERTNIEVLFDNYKNKNSKFKTIINEYITYKNENKRDPNMTKFTSSYRLGAVIQGIFKTKTEKKGIKNTGAECVIKNKDIIKEEIKNINDNIAKQIDVDNLKLNKPDLCVLQEFLFRYYGGDASAKNVFFITPEINALFHFFTEAQ